MKKITTSQIDVVEKHSQKVARFASDIWARLAIKRRHNFITKLVYPHRNQISVKNYAISIHIRRS